jgi:hypothetical protein
MPYNPQIHHRRSICLKGYDYTQPGGYFVTICTKEKQCLFGDIVQGKMRFNSLGAIALAVIKILKLSQNVGAGSRKSLTSHQ